MDKEQNAVVVAEQPKTSLKAKLGTAVAVGTAYALTAMPVHAADDLSSVGSAMSGQIDSAKSIALMLFAAGAVVLGLFIGWKYIKRAGNSA